MKPIKYSCAKLRCKYGSLTHSFNNKYLMQNSELIFASESILIIGKFPHNKKLFAKFRFNGFLCYETAKEFNSVWVVK